MEINMNKIMLTLAATTFACAASIADAQTGFYIGAASAVQGRTVDNAQWGGTFSTGYRFNRYLGTEALVDFTAGTSGLRSNQTVFGLVTAGYPIGSVTPYVLTGVGYGFSGFSVNRNDPRSLWTVGAGVTYDMSDRWQLDARWRRIDGFTRTDHVDRFTFGVNFRF